MQSENLPTFQDVTYERIDAVARITLNRPDYRNALSRRLQNELDAAFGVAMDDDVRVVVLRGAGSCFSAGHDLGTPEHRDDLEARPLPEPELRGKFGYSVDTVLDLPMRLRAFRKPTVAAVHGWCIFGGWKLASAMDIIVASADARFVPGPPQWITLPYEVGPRMAKALLLDDKEIDADRALELGLVYDVCPPDQLDERALALAARLAERTPFLVEMTKAAVNQAQDAMGYRTAAFTALALRQLHHASGEQAVIGEDDRRQLPAVARAVLPPT